MRKINKLAVLALSLTSMGAAAQQSAIYTSELADFSHALSLYNEQEYLAAQVLFQNVKTSQAAKHREMLADCDYYIANCAIRLNQAGAEDKIDQFVKNYPTSIKRQQAYLDITDYFFSKQDYKKALQYATKVREIEPLVGDRRDRFNFQKGYCFFTVKNPKEAKKYLNKVRVESDWGDQALYYLGYMAYDSNNYDDADRLFEKVKQDSKYQEKVGYYRADMNFKTGNFESALKESLKQLDTEVTEQERSELSKITGESYFNLGDYDQSLLYLQQYQGKDGKWSNTDYYQLGYAYYQKKDYEQAIEQFNKIINGDNAVAQNAYYHLGESYLHTGKKLQALNAFKNASEMWYEPTIQQDAFLNYAKLSYDIGNAFESAPAVLSRFVQKYPASPYRAEIQTLLIDSYITSKNYQDALELLEAEQSLQNADIYQRVIFYRALEVYEQGEYGQALKLIERALKQNHDDYIQARALFWKAETLLALNRSTEALAGYVDFKTAPQASQTPEYQGIEYNMGYAYFKQKQYDQALVSFQKYVQNSSESPAKRYDAYVRIGDSNFVLGKYWPAMDAYEKVIQAKQGDEQYARFQKSMAFGFVGRQEDKIQGLKSFIADYPTSNLNDKAQYEIGVSYDVLGQSDQAMQSFDVLLKTYPTSSYAANALLRQGLIYYNKGQSEPALEKFKQVASQWGGTAQGVEAVANARLIYRDSGRMQEYASWVKGLSYIEVSDDQLDADTYESAERQAIQNNDQGAIKGYESYLKNYPNGKQALAATFNLAQLYLAQGETSTAAQYYQKVLSKGKSQYSEVALARLAEIMLKDKNQEAIVVLERLDKEATQQQNQLFAQSNLMKLYYDKANYPMALTYAEKVLSNNKIEDRVKADAQIIIARCAVKTQDFAKAEKAYQTVAGIAKGELAAEALYYKAYFEHQHGNNEASNKTIQQLAKDYSSYKYYGAKGLVLMAQNFYALKDSYQATYILDSVIKNFSEFSDVVLQAQQELDRIHIEEAKRNSSVGQ